MKDKYKGKYRVTTTRMQNWDYGWNAAYFVTICTQNRNHYFGEIADGKMQLSEIGEIANQFWKEIPNHFSYTKLDAFIIMPDHMHGIIIIDNGRGAINRASTDNINSGGITGNKNPMLNNNLSRIIRYYKGRVTFEARKIKPDFTWQSRFHDHIIKNDRAFRNISEYIMKNPMNWDQNK